MQEVSQKWKDLHNTENENYILPQTDVSISFYNVDNSIKGYTDTTYTQSALGKVNAMLGLGYGYNIYFKEGEGSALLGKRISIKWLSDNYYMIGGTITLYDDTFDPTEIPPLTGELWEYRININTTTLDVEIPVDLEIPEGKEIRVIRVYANAYNSNLAIDTINIEEYVTFTKNDFISCELSQSGDLLSFELPQNTFSFELDNINGQYNPDNPNNNLSSLTNHELIYVDITQHYDDGTSETIKGGQYFVEEWDIPQNGITATFKARDITQFMAEKNPFTQRLPVYDGRYRKTDSIATNGQGVINTGIELYQGTGSNLFSINIPFVYNDSGTNKCILGAQSVDNTTNDAYFWFGVNGSGRLECRLNSYTLTTDITPTQGGYYSVFISGWAFNSIWHFIELDLFIQTPNGYKEFKSGRIDYDTPQILPVTPLGLGGLLVEKSIRQKCNIQLTAYDLIENLFFIRQSHDNSGYEDTFKGIPVKDLTTNNYGLYNVVNKNFYTDNGITGGSENDFMSLGDTAYFAFTGSNIPTNPDGTTRYADIPPEMYSIENKADLNNVDCSFAESVQYCCNAAKCVWYFDRNGQSHIKPMSIVQHILPEEYQEVEYIETDGTGQYLDLGVVASNLTTYLTFMANTNSGVVLGTDFGSPSTYYCLIQYNNKYYIGFENSQAGYGTVIVGRKSNFIFNGLQDHKMAINNNVFVTGTNAKSTGNVLLGALKTGTGTISANFDGKFYSCKCFNKSLNQFVRNLVPCYRKADGEIGMYDLVSQRFFTNAGSGSFTKGADVVRETPTTDYDINQFNSYQNAEYSLTEELAAVNINNGLAVLNIQNTGVVQTIDNPFIVDADHALDVAVWIAENLQLRKSVSGDYRPDTRADVYDYVKVDNKYSNNDVYLTSLKYSFGGAFKGSYEGKVFNSQYNNSIDNE